MTPVPLKRATVLAAALLAACGGSSLTADEARRALPTEDQAQIKAPARSSLAADPRSGEAGYQTAPFAASTLGVAAAVNGGTLWTLGVVRFVTSLPPTSCGGDTCTWGGAGSSGTLEMNDWKVTVTRKDERYVWAVAGAPKSKPSVGFVTFVSGNAFPSGAPGVGHGDFVIDLDAASSLDRFTTDPGPGTGTIRATYDNRTSPTLAVDFLGTKDDANPGQKVNAAYLYAQAASGGDLQIAARNLATDAVFTLHSRWTATGAGRGDARFAQGAVSYAESQCWNGTATLFDLVYRASTPANPATDAGAEAACAFAPAQPPSIQAP